MNKKHHLSIVIITRNEAAKINQTLDSVIQACAKLDNYQIMLVDSASSDDTIKIAQTYPINIIQLTDENILTPAAGRHVGYENSDSEYIYFLDGDMLLDENWFENALPIMQADANLAGIAGRCEEKIYTAEGEQISHSADRFVDDDTDMNHLGGSVLYRCAVLDEVGGFNPYLANEEELELGLRIRVAGYSLQRLPINMSLHRTIYDSPENPSGLTWRQIKRDWTVGRYIALGQVLRCLQHNPLKSIYLNLYKRALLMTVFYFSGLLLLLLGVFNATAATVFLLWCGIFFSLFMLRAIYQRHIKDTLLFFTNYGLSAYGFIHGYIKGVPKPEAYQAKIIKLK
jgi:glycosyltransferase involved in cell wall biosynthesis